MRTISIPAPVQGISQQAPELRLPTHVEDQLNCVSHPAYGLGRRTGTDHIRVIPGVTSQDRLWFSWVGRDTFERYAFMFDGRAVRVFGLDGKELPVVSEDGSLSYLSSTDPKGDFEVLSLNDSYLLTNRTKVTAMAPDVKPGVTNVAIVWVRQGNYGQRYAVEFNGTVAEHTTPNGSVATHVEDIRTSRIAQQLAAACTSAFGGATVTYNTGDSHFLIQDVAAGTDFTFGVADSIGNTALGGCKHQAISFDQLPPVAPDGYVARVLGNSGDSADDYWVRWDQGRTDDESGARRGSWVETVAPGSQFKINNTTMPHVLERLQDIDGTVTGQAYSIYFRFRRLDWGERICGSAETSPNPGFIGKTIETAFVVQGRLGFATGATVVLSQSNRPFGFFRSTVTAVQDDDPIDYNINETKRSDEPVINIRHVVGFAEQLMFIADRAQIILPLDQPLSPLNFRPSVMTSFECDPDCKPVSLAGSVMLPFSDGSLTGLREVFTQGPNSAKEDRLLTAHVPRLLRGRPWQVSVCPAENTVFMRTNEVPRYLFVYRFTDINNGRAQSSWGYWDFGSSVLGFGVIESTLYVIVDRPEGPTLESLEIPPYVQTEETPRPLLMDRKTPLGPARLRGRVSSDSGIAASGSTTGSTGTSGVTSGNTIPGSGGGGTPPGGGGGGGGGGSGSGSLSPGPGGSWPEPDETPPTGSGSPLGDTVLTFPDIEGIGTDGEFDSVLLRTPPLVPSGGTTSLVLDARERGVITDYNVLTNVSLVTLPWDPPQGTVFVRADTMEELRWARTGDRTVAIEGDIRAIPVYVGVVFEHNAIFSRCVLVQQSQSGGMVVQRGARIQVVDYQVNYSEAGPFWLEVIRANRGTRLKKITPRRVGLMPMNMPTYGDAKIRCLGKAEDIRVKMASTSHWPCWVVSCSFTAEITSDSQLL